MPKLHVNDHQEINLPVASTILLTIIEDLRHGIMKILTEMSQTKIINMTKELIIGTKNQKMNTNSRNAELIIHVIINVKIL
jgi:hypothetical protein